MLENIEFGLGTEPPGPGEEDYADDDEHDEERKGRIDTLAEWFFARYEDPANRLPYVTAEGGYQWIYGGTYDAREQLDDNFPDEPEDNIEAAVDEIESDGLTEWAPVASPDDYDEYEEEPSGSSDLNDVARELDSLIEDLPRPSGAPTFQVGDDGLIHMATPPDAVTPDADDFLLNELRAAAKDLLEALAGTNTHTDLPIAAQRYAEAINGETTSVSHVYARGVRLANAGEATRSAIAGDHLPPLPQHTDAHLSSVLDLNRAYIMAQPEGREIAEGAAAYQRSPSDMLAMRDAARDFALAVETATTLFGDEVRRHVAEAAADVGKGPQPERSNQTAASVFGNLTWSLLKDIGKAAITGSAPAVARASGGTQFIDLPGLSSSQTPRRSRLSPAHSARTSPG